MNSCSCRPRGPVTKPGTWSAITHSGRSHNAVVREGSTQLTHGRSKGFLLCVLVLLSVITLVQRRVPLAAQSPELILAANAQPMAEVGGAVKYTVTLANSGFAEASNVVITHTLPLGFSYQPGSTEVELDGEEVSSTDPGVDGQHVTWGPFTIPGATRVFDNVFGIHTFVQDLCLPSYVDFQLDKALELAGMGGHVTQLLYPVTASTEGPNPCSVYFVDGAYDRDLVPIVRVQGEWGGDYWLKPEPDSPGDYTSIAQAYKSVVQGLPRRDGRILYVQVWNEPDLWVEWSGEPNAWEYGSFFVDVAAAVHSIGDSRIRVLNGALTPGNAGFTRRLVGVPGFAESFDLWASHCYPLNHPPTYNIHNGTARYPQYTIDCYLLELQALASYGGRSGVKVILTETGYGLYDWTFRFEGYSAINESNRAYYMKRAFRDFWVSWPEVVGVTPFELVDPYGTPRWDWLYPTTDLPHEQFNAVKALPKPDATEVIPAVLTISFQAQAAGSPGTYYSDVSGGADNATISPLTGVAPVRVVDQLYLKHFPLASRGEGGALTRTERQSASEAARQMEELLHQLDSWQAEPILPPVAVVPLASPEEPWEAPQISASIELGPDPQGIAVDPLGQRAYITLGDGSLATVDTLARRIVCTTPVGRDSQAVAVNTATGLVYVANSGEGTVSVVDGAGCRVVDTISGLSRPSGLAVDELANRIYVTDAEAGYLVVVDGASHRIMERVPVGAYPDAVVTDSGAGVLYVANAGDGTLSVIEESGLEVVSTIQIAQGPLLGMAVHGPLGRAYVVYLASPLRREIAVVDVRRGEVVARLAGDVGRPLGNVYAVAVDEERSRLYIADGSDLLVVDERNQALMASVPAETVTYNFGLAVDATREEVYLLDSSRGTLLVVSD
ncbi:MAG: hypothetical protein CEE40_00185 [Chloroflexi bacterium B3_Chlor]|nr:MAG: hypothetical protein CEE40_00185 [Chloroflexi bacterium B3_Chlor]